MSYTYGKTALLLITTHGGVDVEIGSTGSLQPMTMDIPRRMNLVLVETAVLGVVNVLEPESVDVFAQVVRDTVRELNLNDNTTKDEMVNIAEEIKRRLIEVDNTRAEVTKSVRRGIPGYSDDPEVIDYVHNIPKAYNVYSGTYYIDKEFLRVNEQTTPLGLDWKVNLLNLRNGTSEDLMKTMSPYNTMLRSADKEHSIINMRDIIEHLRSRGYKNVLAVDLTCSVIMQNVTPSDTRSTRRNALRDRAESDQSYESYVDSRKRRRTGGIGSTRKKYKNHQTRKPRRWNDKSKTN
jgi:hypothetical protein